MLRQARLNNEKRLGNERSRGDLPAFHAQTRIFIQESKIEKTGGENSNCYTIESSVDSTFFPLFNLFNAYIFNKVILIVLIIYLLNLFIIGLHETRQF
jgi:hypothetical protein